MLLGREVECARVEELLRDGGALVLRGEPGVGKSTLLGHAASAAEGRSILRATGVESESELSYAGLHALLDPVLALRGALPEPQAQALARAFGLEPGRVEDRFLVALATLGMLRAAEAVCLVDDAQWLDRASADAIAFAARRLGPGAAVALLATRASLGPGLDELELSGLAPEAAGALLGDGLGPTVRERLVAATRGNPLALLELPRILSAAQLEGTEPIAEPLPAGEEVERAFLGAIRGLSADAQGHALLVAADATQHRATVCAAAAHLGLDAAAIDALEATGLVRSEGTRVALRHPLVRSAVYGAAGAQARRRAHLALAAVLDGERRTWHRAAAAEGPDPEVAAELERLAEDARERSAHAAAAAALERAAALTAAPADRGRLLAAAAEASWDAGHVDRVGPLLTQALPLLGAREREALGLLRGDLALELGRPAEAFELFVSAASGVGPRRPAFALEMLWRAAEATWWLGETRMSSELERLGAEVAHTDEEAAALLMRLLRGSAHVLKHDFERGVADLREALHIADGVGSRLGMAAGFAAVHAGAPAEGRDWFARVAARLRTEGRLRELPFALSQLGTMEVWVGNVGTAANHVEEARRLARETGQQRSAAHAAVTMAMITATRGEEAASRACAAEALEGAIGSSALQTARSRWALARLELGLGRPEEALALLESIRDAGQGISHPLVALTSVPDLVEAAVRAGRPEAGTEPLREFAGWAQASRDAWPAGVLSRLRALTADGEEADRHFEASLAKGADFPFDQARTRLLYGEWLRRNRRRSDAREHLRAAESAFDALGARPWAERARLELRATGVTGGRAAGSGLDELTPQERRIALLVAEGATNKEIAAQLYVSVRTVEYHLHKAFTKLGIASRHALARLVADDGAQQTTPSSSLPLLVSSDSETSWAESTTAR